MPVWNKAKILNEVINAKINSIEYDPEDYTYDHDDLIESSRDRNTPIQIFLDNGEILLVYGMMRLSRD